MVDATAFSEQDVWDALAECPRPRDPGRLAHRPRCREERDVDGADVIVEFTPTFMGCPALERMQLELAQAVEEIGGRAEVRVLLDDSWSTDRITPEGREKLRARRVRSARAASGREARPRPAAAWVPLPVLRLDGHAARQHLRPDAVPLDSLLQRLPPAVRAVQDDLRRKRKCTEPVATSSGFPTDRRRSDCHSESHQPRTLRTRCMGEPEDPLGPRSRAPRSEISRKLRKSRSMSGSRPGGASFYDLTGGEGPVDRDLRRRPARRRGRRDVQLHAAAGPRPRRAGSNVGGGVRRRWSADMAAPSTGPKSRSAPRAASDSTTRVVPHSRGVLANARRAGRAAESARARSRGGEPSPAGRLSTRSRSRTATGRALSHRPGCTSERGARWLVAAELLPSRGLTRPSHDVRREGARPTRRATSRA